MSRGCIIFRIKNWGTGAGLRLPLGGCGMKGAEGLLSEELCCGTVATIMDGERYWEFGQRWR